MAEMIEYGSKFFTRIQLKYDTWAKWEANKTKKPLKGEVCLVEVPNGASSGMQDVPPSVLMKVGDGVKTFEELPWLSALAADVHSWAKKSEADFGKYLADNTFSYVVDGETKTFKVASSAELEALRGAVNGIDGRVKVLEDAVGVPENYNGDTAFERIADLEAALGADGTGSDSISSRVGALEVSMETVLGDKDTAGSIAEAKAQADKGVADAAAVSGALATEKGRIDTLVGTDTNKSVRAIATEAIAAYADPEVKEGTINTLTEILEWMQGVDEAEGGAAALIKDISKIQEYLGEQADGSYPALEAGVTVPVAINKNTDNIEALLGEVNTIKGSLGADGATTQAIAAAKQGAIDTVVGASGDASSANTVYGAKKYAEEKATAAQSAAELTAKNYTDAEIDKVEAELLKINSNLTGAETVEGSVNARIAAALKSAKDYADQSETDAINAVVGDADDVAADNTVYGAKAYADKAVEDGIKEYKAGVDATIGTLPTNKTVAQAIVDAQAAAEKVANDNKAAVIGVSGDTSDKDTIFGAKKYAEEKASAAEQAAKDYADDEIEKVSGAITSLSGRPFVAVEKNGKDADGNINYVVFYCGSAEEMF